MNILESLSEFLDSLDVRDFYKYIGITLGTLLLCVSFIVYRFYSNVGYYKKQIHAINMQREEIQDLLEKAALIKAQKQEVNAMLEKEPNFKIVAYFNDVLTQLQLTNKQVSRTETSLQERGEQDYNEKILTAKFTDMNMRELSELLNVIEQNKRVYTKELEMQKKSRKNTQSLEVQLTIATLAPRTESEFVE